MKVLVIGGGGREHALVWRLLQSPSIERVYCAPGNAGVSMLASCIPASVANAAEVAELAATLQADLVAVGPEAPLVAGVADHLAARKIPVVGPAQAAAQLEASKVFSKELMQAAGIPTADAVVVETPDQLQAEIDRFGFPVALKADGLAAGKGVVVARSKAEALDAGARMLAGELVGEAGVRLLVERFVPGREISFIVLTDGSNVLTFPPSRDYKRAFDHDEGPNTGGMGAFSDDGLLDANLRQRILDQVVLPALEEMRRRHTPFRGFLYCGLMLTEDSFHVLEFNVRLGDPETQALLLRVTGDFAELLLSAARGSLDSSLVSWDSEPAASVVLASEGYPGDYAKGFPIDGLVEAEKRGATVFHAGTLFRAGRLVTAGGRVLAVSAKHSTLSGALGRCYEALPAIRFEGARYRRDIGQVTDKQV